MCGSRTAANALQAAAQIAAVRSPEQVTPDNWEPFLDSLTSIATVMCGETGVHLIREGGRMHPE